MNKYILMVLVLATVLMGGFYLSTYTPDNSLADRTNPFIVSPVSHASFAMQLGGVAILNDPVGEVVNYEEFAAPLLILLSDIHGDHLDVDTLVGVVTENTSIIAPQAVFDELPVFLQVQTTVMSNGDAHTVAGLMIEAVPMYNLPMEGEDYRHVKGRGNGYILEADGKRVYIAGDTEDIPEMRALEGIDVAFIPMNLPYTMDVATAAEGVLAFAPTKVYPYHYRGAEGLADVAEFARLVGEDNPSIEVVQLDWYTE